MSEKIHQILGPDFVHFAGTQSARSLVGVRHHAGLTPVSP